MASRAAPVKRVEKPLLPIVAVLTVMNDSVAVIELSKVTPETVGLKAYGLASLPSAWTLPFFVVPHDSSPSNAAIKDAVARLGISSDKKLIVRSSGVDESIASRGNLESAECDVASLTTQIARLRKTLAEREVGVDRRVHWVVQRLLPTLAKGHLSNERRIAEHKRDWVAEVESSASHAVEIRPISLRSWRDSAPPTESALSCQYRAKYTQCLTTVAKWAYKRLIRLHFEWVWDGHAVYIVQADACDESGGGVEPRDLVHIPPVGGKKGSELQVFREATSADYQQYRKLANARVYRECGYAMVPFYVLDDETEIRRIVEHGQCSDALRCDLDVLVARPLVIRTDGQLIPEALRQMLPRSEELRSVEAAEHWLLNDFRELAVQEKSDSAASLIECKPCLIAHHFLPATAAAWCQARPDQRRVRIESLWGLPEGLYWYAYDAFDVDTQVPTIDSDTQQPRKMAIHQRRRFKERFVAPDAAGRWVLHKTAAGPDWQRSIKRTEWIEEIAWNSRRIASAVGHPIVVMWFVDVPKAASEYRVLPWYHEPWKAGASPHKAAPRRKLSTTADFVLKGKADWESLKAMVNSGEQVVRIKVRPDEPEIVRDRKFAEELAQFVNQHKLVVELEGGVLSHAYYMLSRAGCDVECADLDDYATDDYELEFNKLVRDKIPASIAAKGETVTVLRVAGEALIAALRRKLVEESLEVLDARTAEEIAEELADLREVALSLMSRLDITEADVEVRRKRKAKLRGAFGDALMLSRTAVAPSMGFRELHVDGGAQQSLVSLTIDQEAAIPSAFAEIHADKRVDAAGVVERQFTIDVPAHASGYKPTRVAFSMSTQSGKQHEMVFELLIGRRGADLRVRARVMNAIVQLDLGLDDGNSSVSSPNANGA